MFRDTFRKKIWVASTPVGSSVIASVPASMRPLAPAAGQVLEALVRHTPVSIAEAHRDADGDWFRLSSPQLQEHEVFHRLRSNWQPICGPNWWHVALIHCLTEPGRGVWLLCRSAGAACRHAPGVHQLSAWS